MPKGQGCLFDSQVILRVVVACGARRLIIPDAQALRGVWVNIHDFLAAENKPDDVVFFKSQRQLALYTLKTKKIFPRREIPPGSPLRDLLARILR